MIEPQNCPFGNEAVLNGRYAFVLQGSLIRTQPGIQGVAGSFVADGTGKITSGEEDGAFPPATILLGQANYPGHDERVYLTFDHGLLPDGQEIVLQARGLSSRDYAPGIVGDFHNNTGSQMASVVGLSMVSGMSEIMVEKEGLGNSFESTPKATLKNGVYNGLSKVTEMQANRQAEKLAQIPDYVTVSEGSDVIISLTGSYRSGNGK